MNFNKLSTFLVCPRCHNGLANSGSSITCFDCGLDFVPNENGFFDFAIGLPTGSIDTGKDGYVKIQEAEAPRVYKEWLEPFLASEPVSGVLT